jgi:hypothetical protein
MAETLDQATLLRNKARAKRAKSGNRVTAETRLAVCVKFLNDDNMEFLAVENVYAPGTKYTQIVAGFRTVILENKLDELVYPVVDGDHVFLIKLTDPEADEQ